VWRSSWSGAALIRQSNCHQQLTVFVSRLLPPKRVQGNLPHTSATPGPTHLHVGVTCNSCWRRRYQLLQAAAAITTLRLLLLLLGMCHRRLDCFSEAVEGGGGRGRLVQWVYMIGHLWQQWQARGGAGCDGFAVCEQLVAGCGWGSAAGTCMQM
jgi:hypothetical protein